MRALVVLLLLGLAIVPVASSHGAWSHCGASDVELGDGDSGTVYVVPEENAVSLYQESNGVQHLQRGGASEIIPDDTEACNECMFECGPEMMIF